MQSCGGREARREGGREEEGREAERIDPVTPVPLNTGSTLDRHGGSQDFSQSASHFSS